MTQPSHCDDWPALLDSCVQHCKHFNNLIVLRETESTQDAAVAHHAKPGTIVTTYRQSAGRGRLGRRWADTGEEGIAVTLVVPPTPAERLSILSAVAIARAAEQCLARESIGHVVGIRWPNDIMVTDRKLAGILVEQDQHAARIGVGMNVLQRSFSADIADRAVSLVQLGCSTTRAEALRAIIQSVDGALDETTEALAQEFSRRDLLCGRIGTFEHNRTMFRGCVMALDPLRGLKIDTDVGEVFLPAQTTSVLNSDERTTVL